MLFSDALYPCVINGSGLMFLETGFSIPLSTLYLLARWLCSPSESCSELQIHYGEWWGGQARQLELWQQVPWTSWKVCRRQSLTRKTLSFRCWVLGSCCSSENTWSHRTGSLQYSCLCPVPVCPPPLLITIFIHSHSGLITPGQEGGGGKWFKVS